MALFHRIEGRDGLAAVIEAMLEASDARNNNNPEDVFVFDFDRTLTNGFANPNDKLEMEQRIRGGEKTLRALRALKSRNVPMFIVTARNPSRLTIEQLEASMQNCQAELSELFLDAKAREQDYVLEKLENGMNLAHRGFLYASDYSKPNAIRHLLANKVPNARRVHFFDDFVGNAFDVGMTDFGDFEVHTYWWDSFIEEKRGEMGLVSSFSSDFTYQPGTSAARDRFGLPPTESENRLAWILQHEKERGLTKPPIEVDKPVVKKMDMSAFQGLAFAPPGKRFPVPPPAATSE